MYVVFFMANRSLLLHQVPTRTTIDVVYYRNERFTRLVEKLHHDNARLHVKDIVIDYLHDQTDISQMDREDETFHRE